MRCCRAATVWQPSLPQGHARSPYVGAIAMKKGLEASEVAHPSVPIHPTPPFVAVHQARKEEWKQWLDIMCLEWVGLCECDARLRAGEFAVQERGQGPPGDASFAHVGG